MILVVGDIQARGNTIDLRDKYKNKLSEIYHAMQDILQEAVRRETRVAIFAGDIADTKDNIEGATAVVLSEIINSFTSSGIEVVLLQGNHDLIQRSTDRSLCDIYRNDKVSVIKQPTVLHDLLLLPYDHDVNPEIPELALTAKSQICISHMPLDGYELHAGIVDTGLDISTMSNISIIMQAHYHRPADFIWSEKGSKRIIVLGSVIPWNWNDIFKRSDPPRSVCFIDPETYQISKYEHWHGSDFVEINVDNTDDVFVEMIAKSVSNPSIKFTGSEKLIDQRREALLSMFTSVNRVLIQPTVHVPDNIKNLLGEASDADIANPLDTLSRYIDIAGCPEDVSKDAVLHEVNEIISDVLQKSMGK